MFTWQFQVEPPAEGGDTATWQFKIEPLGPGSLDTITWQFLVPPATPESDTVDWHFQISDIIVDARHCYRGPMTAVEKILAVPFIKIVPYDFLREALYNAIVSTEQPPVRTREIVLRALNSPHTAFFPILYSQRKQLQVTICEKREVFDIYADLEHLQPLYRNAVQSLVQFSMPTDRLTLLVDAMNSLNITERVSSICAAVLLMAYIEMESR